MHVLLLISTQQSIFTLNLLIFFCHVHRKCNKRNIFKYCRFVALFIKMKTLESKMFVILKRKSETDSKQNTKTRGGRGGGHGTGSAGHVEIKALSPVYEQSGHSLNEMTGVRDCPGGFRCPLNLDIFCNSRELFC